MLEVIDANLARQTVQLITDLSIFLGYDGKILVDFQGSLTYHVEGGTGHVKQGYELLLGTNSQRTEFLLHYKGHRNAAHPERASVTQLYV